MEKRGKMFRYVLGIPLLICMIALVAVMGIHLAWGAAEIVYYNSTGENSMEQHPALSFATGKADDPATIACGGTEAVTRNVVVSGKNLTTNATPTIYRTSGYAGITNVAVDDLKSKILGAIQAKDYIDRGAAIFFDGATAGQKFEATILYPAAGTHNDRPISATLKIMGTATGKSHQVDLAAPATATSSYWGNREVTCPVIHVTNLLVGGSYTLNATNVCYELSFKYIDDGESVTIDDSLITALSQNKYNRYNERVYVPAANTTRIAALSSDEGGHMEITTDTQTSGYGATIVSTPLENIAYGHDRIGAPLFTTNATEIHQSGTTFRWGASNFDTPYSAPGNTVADTYGVSGWNCVASVPLAPAIPDDPVKVVTEQNTQPNQPVHYTISQKMGGVNADVVTTYKSMKFTDTLPGELTYNNDFKVFDFTGADVTATAGSLQVSSGNPTTLTYTFNQQFLGNPAPGDTSEPDLSNYNGKTITFTFSGNVKNGTADGTVVKNKAKTTFNDAYNLETEEVTTTIDNKIPIHFVDGLNNQTIEDQSVSYNETPVAPTPPTHEGYSFTGWDKTIVPATEETTYIANYEKIKIPIHFVDGLDNQPIENQTVDYNDTPVAPTPPTHEHYTFVGWDKTIVPATEETTYTANYEPIKIPIHFVDGLDNQPIENQSVDYNETPVAPTPPTHEHYTFVGWDKTIVPATEETTYTANYEPVKIPIHFVDGLNNQPIDNQNVDYNETPVTPTPPTHEHYTFTGWDKEVVPATEETTYTANYEPVKIPIHFVDGLNNQPIENQSVDYNETPVTPTPPTHEHYTFTGWDKEVVPATEETTYTANYEPVKIPIHFVDGLNNQPIENQSVDYNAMPVTPTPPTHEHYTFTGWDKTVVPATEEATYTANYEPVKIPIHFVDGLNNQTINDQSVDYNAMPVTPTPPTHEGYNFTGWDKTVVPATAEATYTANYVKIKIPIHFVDGMDNKLIEDQSVDYNDVPNPPTPPTHEGYNFKSWDKTIVPATKETTYTATYTKGQIPIHFVDGLDNKPIENQVVDYNDTPVAPLPPTHEGYTFTGWDKPIVPATGETTYTANYKKTKVPIHFVDGVDNKTIEDQSVDYNDTPKPPTPPTHEGYTFTGWDKEIVPATGETTYTANYKPVKIPIHFVDGQDDKTIEDQNVDYNNTPQPPTPPAHEGFTFVGWDKEIVPATEEVTYKANYAKSYTVIFRLPDDTVLKTETVLEHGKATAPDDPTLDGYTFVGWDKEFSDIVADTTVTAILKPLPKPAPAPTDNAKTPPANDNVNSKLITSTGDVAPLVAVGLISISIIGALAAVAIRRRRK